MKRVGVLRGGQGKNYLSSIREGGDIIFHILENLGERWKPVDIFIDQEGTWHLGGLEVSPDKIRHKVDLVWNTAHHSAANVLEKFSLPLVGLSPFKSLVLRNPDLLEHHAESIGLKAPQKIVLPLYQADFDGPVDEYAVKKAHEVHKKFPAPWTVKTYTEDESMASPVDGLRPRGLHLAKTFPELVRAIEDGVRHKKSILVEEFVYGNPASVHSVEGFRGDEVYVFPPERLSREEKELVQQVARDLHRHLDAGHYLRSDLVIHPKRGIFVTSVSFNPDLRPGSHLSQACASVGAEMHHVVEHILERALR